MSLLKLFAILTLLLTTCEVFSQGSSVSGSLILFRGVVIDASALVRLSGSRIFVNGEIRSVSRDDGTFSFFVVRSDTVTFTMLGYKPSTLIISDTIRAREYLAGVYLQPDTIDIGEVIILPRFPALGTELLNTPLSSDVYTDNARSNINIASWQGRSSVPKMGDPALNYEYLRQKQRTEAYEKGGIPSDRMVGLSPLLLVPAAYLLIHGMPEKPEPPEPKISQKELDELNKIFLEKLRRK